MLTVANKVNDSISLNAKKSTNVVSQTVTLPLVLHTRFQQHYSTLLQDIPMSWMWDQQLILLWSSTAVIHQPASCWQVIFYHCLHLEALHYCKINYREGGIESTPKNCVHLTEQNTKITNNTDDVKGQVVLLLNGSAVDCMFARNGYRFSTTMMNPIGCHMLSWTVIRQRRQSLRTQSNVSRQESRSEFTEGL